MRRIPCRECSNCGLINDFTVSYCECGADLSLLPIVLMEPNLPPDRYGAIREDLPVYVQKCSYCGAQNYTAEPEHPVKRCWNCQKTRIAGVKPVLFEDVSAPEKKVQPDSVPEISLVVQISRCTSAPSTAPSADEDDRDEDVAFWKNLLDRSFPQNPSTASAPADKAEELSFTPTFADNPQAGRQDEDDEEIGDWNTLLGHKNGNPGVAEAELTLTAACPGSAPVTLKASQAMLPYMIGRSAHFQELLSRDLQIGNEHCFITFRDGGWYVTDNDSKNGTSVNQYFLNLIVDGERHPREKRLCDGDTLVLGHRPDSIAFHIGIR